VSGRVRVADPAALDRTRRDSIEAACARVLSSGQYILGPEVTAFEEEFARYCGAAHGVGVASGTDALALALEAVGLRPGQPVFSVSHTAVATVAAIEQAGGRPVLVDVDPATLTLDPEALEPLLSEHLSGAALESPRGAIVPVHLYGHPADLSRLSALAARNGLALVEDCAQAHGAALAGRRAGAHGDAAAFSFYPTKNLGAIGDGGMVVTHRPEVAERVRALRQYGWDARRSAERAGRNSRLDELQAAILRAKLPELERDNARRRAIAARYAAGLAGTGLVLPVERPGAHHVYHLYVVQAHDRDRLRARLLERDIETAVHYPLAVHQQPAYRGRLAGADRLARTESAVERILSLPMHPALSDDDVDRVIASVCAVCA
jgi:dTDP-4-amino-4,6-dideoxygalactose transaminase